MPGKTNSYQSRLRRPHSVTFLSLVGLIFAGFYLTRVFVVLRHWSFWETQYLPNANAYLLVTGMVWGILFFWLAIGLLSGRRGSARLLKIVTPLYVAYYWLERIVLSRLTSSSSSWLFSLGITLAGMVLVYWLLSRAAVKLYLGDDAHE
jgi:hypothetical protein